MATPPESVTMASIRTVLTGPTGSAAGVWPTGAWTALSTNASARLPRITSAGDAEADELLRVAARACCVDLDDVVAGRHPAERDLDLCGSVC